MSRKTRQLQKNKKITGINGTKTGNADKPPVDRLKQFNSYNRMVYTPEIEERNHKGRVYYSATLPEFPNIVGTGYTLEEAIKDLNEVKALAIQDLMDDNEKIPLPRLVGVENFVFETGKPFEIKSGVQDTTNLFFNYDLSEVGQTQNTVVKELESGISMNWVFDGAIETPNQSGIPNYTKGSQEFREAVKVA